MPSRVPLRVLSGNSPMDELPEVLDLSELADDMERLWAKSIARLDEGIVIEYAATIVIRTDGSLKLSNEVAGNSANVLPQWAVADPGTFHTHPRIDGLLPMPFSDTDFVSALQLREKLSVLYSDDIVFALASALSTSDNVDLFEIRREFLSFWTGLDTQAKFLPNVVWEANKVFAARYGFGLNVGNAYELYREV
jgi:hypothetical protein